MYVDLLRVSCPAALSVGETWSRSPEALWKSVARELMQSPIADKKVRQWLA